MGGTAYASSFTSMHVVALTNDTNIKNNGRRQMHNAPLATKETVSAFINDYQATCCQGQREVFTILHGTVVYSTLNLSFYVKIHLHIRSF